MQVPPIDEGGAETPLAALGQCHQCIARMLARLEAVTAEAATAPPSDLPQRAHAIVTELDEAMGVHMVDEEPDMFPAVLAAADSPARRAQAFALVSALLVKRPGDGRTVARPAHLPPGARRRHRDPVPRASRARLH